MNWKSARLSEITNILSGTTPESSKSLYWGGSNVWITPTDLGKSASMYLSDSERKITNSGISSCNLPRIPKGSVVMSSRAPIGHLAIAGCDLYTNQGCKSFVCPDSLDPEFLYFILKHQMHSIQALGRGATFVEVSKSALQDFEISFPSIGSQRRITARLKDQHAAVECACNAANIQLDELVNLASAIIRQSVEHPDTTTAKLGDVLDEVKKGIGKTWADYPVLGATRAGLALAKEPVGKSPERYKPVLHGTVFYNPMRIMIGSIAMVDEDDTPGITSPDYVALRGKSGLVDSRWFYYWLRSPYGVSCIASLARGAVRERMLFNRLAEGNIELPTYEVQVAAAKALAELKPMQTAIKRQLSDINLLPAKILAKAFDKAA